MFLTLKKVSSHRIMNPWIPLADFVVNLNISSKNKCKATKFMIFKIFSHEMFLTVAIGTTWIFEKSLFCKNLININRGLLIVSHKGLVSLRISLTVMVYLSIVIWINDKKLTQFLKEPIKPDRYAVSIPVVYDDSTRFVLIIEQSSWDVPIWDVPISH